MSQIISPSKILPTDFYITCNRKVKRILGTTAASFIDKLSYWMGKENIGRIHDGKHWIFNKAEDWAAQIDCSKRKFWRVVRTLKELGIILVKKLSPYKSNHTNYYTLDEERLQQVIEEHSSPMEPPTTFDDKSTMIVPNGTKVIKTNTTNKNKSNKSNKSERISKKISAKEEEGSLPHHSEDTLDVISDAFNAPLTASTGGTCVVQPNENLTSVIGLPVDSRAKGDGTSHIPPRGRMKIDPPPKDRVHVQNAVNILNEEAEGVMNVPLNRSRSRYLMGALKHKFNYCLKKWKDFCQRIASSEFLMGRSKIPFRATLDWILKFKNIDKILAGEWGVKTEKHIMSVDLDREKECEQKAINHIKTMQGSDPCKKIYINFLNMHGAPDYVSWILTKKIRFVEKDGNINIVCSHPRWEQHVENNYRNFITKQGLINGK